MKVPCLNMEGQDSLLGSGCNTVDILCRLSENLSSMQAQSCYGAEVLEFTQSHWNSI